MTRLTPKQERFAQLFVELGNATAAYRGAYDVADTTLAKTVHESACRLASKPNVGARIAELQAEARARHRVTVDRLTGELLDTVMVAKQQGAPRAMVDALYALMQLHGLGVEKLPGGDVPRVADDGRASAGPAGDA